MIHVRFVFVDPNADAATRVGAGLIPTWGPYDGDLIPPVALDHVLVDRRVAVSAVEVLSLPGTAFSDEPRALELLDPVARNVNGELNGLALLLATNLQERKRLDASAQGLQQKLDALRSLERSMIERRKK